MDSSSETLEGEVCGNMFPPQREVVDSGLLNSGFSVVLQMPTGSGKTWLAEQAMRRTLQQGGRAIYLTPLRALARELASRWKGRYGNVSVGVFTGDYGKPGRPYPVAFRDATMPFILHKLSSRTILGE